MLHFFRKYQKIFFFLTTVIVVFSFIFFGTYQSIAPSLKNKNEEEENYVSQMSRFLNTEQWMISRNFFEGNFLNDGFISKEFLETGMAEIVADTYPELFQKDFDAQFEKEKTYQPYTHPYHPSLSANHLWSMFAPDIPAKLKAFQKSNGGFKERNELFLAQKNFPPAFLSQIIRYQEKSNPNIPSDPRLAKEDTTLFAYHNLTDWFGQNFIDTISELIIKTAECARSQGYTVSKNELLAELVSRSQEVYKNVKGKMQLPVEDGYGLFLLYLNQMGLSEKVALKIWEDVTLFRRLLHAVGNGSALIDTLGLSAFYAYAYENALIEVIQMPSEFRLKAMKDLKLLEVYLAAVGEKRSSALSIPLEYASVESIESRAPELVGRWYQLLYAETSKKALHSKVTVKETLLWESLPENWQILQKQFPELAQKKGPPFEVLEAIDEKGRKNIDAFAREQIIKLHPEWIDEALVEAELKEKEIFLNDKTEKSFLGISDQKNFLAALNSQEELMRYTQDGTHYYRFLVKKRGVDKEILSYGQALKNGLLEKLSEAMSGDSLVQAIVAATPSEYKESAFSYRFAEFMSQYKDAFPQGNLVQQFQFDKKQKSVTRSEPSFISLDQILAQKVGSFSEVGIDAVEGPYIYRFVEKRREKNLPLEKLMKTQEILSKEARCRYFQNLLTRISFSGQNSPLLPEIHQDA